jgi:Transcription termination factor nusG
MMESLQGLEQEWYVIYSKPHQEERAQYHLRSKGVHVLLPRLDLPGAFQRKKRLVPLYV